MNIGDDVTKEIGQAFDRLKSLGYNDGNVQTIVHQGVGAFGPAAIVACFCTIFMMVVVTVILVHENDKLARRIEILEAWHGVDSNALNEVKGELRQLEK